MGYDKERNFRIREILENLNRAIINHCDGWPLGIDLSFVDHKEGRLEVFSYGIVKYHNSVEVGFGEVGSLLLSENIFKDSSSESKYEYLKGKRSFKGNRKIFKGPIVDEGFTERKRKNPRHKNWQNHHNTNGLSGLYIFEGKRKMSDFDIVLFGLIEVGDKNKEEAKEKIKEKAKNFLNLDAFALVFERFRQSQKKMREHALQAAVASILARNYAHHIGSHVKNRANLTNIKERIENIYTK